MSKKIALLLVSAVLFFSVLSPALAQSQTSISITDSAARMEFPFSLNVSAQIRSEVNISDVRLRYWIEQTGFAEVTSEAYVNFIPSNTLNPKYSLDMRKVGGLPSGTNLEFWWVVTNVKGDILESPRQQFTVVDSRYNWRETSHDKVNIFWYQGNENFSQSLMTAAEQSLSKLANDTGATPDQSVDIYIYANSQDLQGSMIFPQEWTGGVAFTQFNIIAIGIAPDNLAWGQRAMTHELTHVVISQVTSNPYNDLPVWLNEGLAMYSEGPLEVRFSSLLKAAITNDSLISVRSLSSPFSSDTNISLLSYAESFSLVDYLVDTYGSSKMLDLLKTFQAGTTYDGAFQTVYGFDMESLSAKWKEWITSLYNG